MGAMFLARLICSDQDCAEEREVEVATLDELERLACACGCTFQVIGWPDRAGTDEGAVVVHARFGRRDGPGLLDAA
jgi:hypothetical protein